MKRRVGVTGLALALILVLGCGDGGPSLTGGDEALMGGGAGRIVCASSAECDDANPCTDDACIDRVCRYTDNTSPCNDGDGCTMDDTCSGGSCTGAPLDEDGDTFLSDACGGADCDDIDPHVNPDATEGPYDDPGCSDGVDNDCDGLTDVEEAACNPCDTLEDCDDGNPCTDEQCVEARCGYADNVNPCDDGNGCTMDDTCSGRSCSGVPLDEDRDGFVSGACGGDDCDDARAGVHPEQTEGPSGDPTCADALDNDCDDLVDWSDPLCQGPSTTVELVTDSQVAPNETELEITVRVGAGQASKKVLISYSGSEEVLYFPTVSTLSSDGLALSVEPVTLSLPIPFGTLFVDLAEIRVFLDDPDDIRIGHEGSFSTNARLRVQMIASVSMNGRPVIEGTLISVTSDVLNLAGYWISRGDTDGDSREEYDLLVTGQMVYEMIDEAIPLIGIVSATISGELQLGYRGEEI